MGVYAAAITKQFAWRDQQEKFSNVYTVKHSNPTQVNFDALASTLATWEKSNFGPWVSFLTARVWGPLVYPGNGISQQPDKTVSVTQHLSDIPGAGTNGLAGVMYKELCVVGSWYLGRAPGTGRKRFMRKYWHTDMASVPTTASVNDGAAMSQQKKSDITLKLNALESNLSSAGWTLCAPNGDTASGPATTLPQFHIRQLRQ